MISVEVHVDTSRFDRMLSDMPAAMARAQQKSLKAIGGVVKRHTVDAFRDPSLRPSPWPPRKSGGTHQLLIKSGDLRDNFRAVVTRPDTVTVGTKVKYAGYHQTGTKHMPARPFFPVDKNGNLTPGVMDDIMENVQAIYDKELEKILA